VTQVSPFIGLVHVAVCHDSGGDWFK